ncbi:MAG: Ig-like domain-containing protein [Gammaproteobacteria bacterium]|nr:Ig-like domain-containing protein [Gammaproteobacteria bacterium]
MESYFTDPDGDALSFAAASANTGVASAETAGSTVTITGVSPGTARVTVTATDPAGISIQQAFAVTVPNWQPYAVGTIPGQSVESGQTVTVDVSPFFTDPDGQPLSYTAASSDQRVATATADGSAVTVAGVAAGTATITVTATDPGELTAQHRFSVTVRAANQAPEVVSTIPDLSLTVDEVRAWQGADHFRDPNGDPLTYAAGSSNAAVVLALVSGAEFGIGAVSVGSAVVTVTASDPGGLSAQFSFRVTVQPGTQTEVVISGVEPTVLVEGAEARITGSGFSATTAQNQVSLGGRGARVTAATGTSLTIVVPRADCLPPRREELRVAVGSENDTRTVGVTPQSLEVEPNHYWYTYGGNGCLHLPGSASRGEYLIGVTSSSENAASLTGITLTGTPWDASTVATENGRLVVAADGEALDDASRSGMAVLAQGPFNASAAFAPQSALPMAPASAGGGIGEWPLAADTLRMRRARAHNEIMARNQALLRRLGRATRPALADARRDLQVGDTLTLYADFPEAGLCTNSGQVRALVRLVGNSSIWLDDLDNPAGTFTDSELASLDAFYSDNVRDVHDDYFGRLSDVDGNGRFLVLMTKEVNRVALGGWVWFGDLVSSTQCATSNRAEIFYGRVPDPHGVVGTEVSKQDLLDDYPELIAHEVTHLVQANARVLGNAGWKTTWEKEGGASLAEQLVAYRIFGHGSGQELGWAAYNHSAQSRNWYWDWLSDMAAFFGRDWRGDGTGRISRAPEECSWVGGEREGNSGPCLGRRQVYGVPSMVLRYAMDRWGDDYPGGERALIRRFTQSPQRGFASLVDVSPGREWTPEYILADFYITLWLDLQPGRRTYGMSTWDLYDLFRRWPSNWQLQPYTSSSHTPRLTGRRVRAGSSLYFHWTPAGALSRTSIKVTSPGGGRVPDHISVWALRLR